VSLTQLNSIELKKAFILGAKNLEAKKDWINELNVFPVPDGDTGTNMTMTIMSAVKEVSASSDDMKSVCKAISSGSLKGARGNSGVILSQLLRGFTKVAADYESLDTMILSIALEKATETAYKAVMRPKEGTILTVAKAMSTKALEIYEDFDDVREFIKAVLDAGDEALAKTPELLPVLKQAGVVDSGGQGLMEIIRGVYDSVMGKELDYSSIEVSKAKTPVKMGMHISKGDVDTANIKFGYCTEFIINLDKEFKEEDEHSFKAFLETIGDSLVCVSDDEVVKIHVHTNDPGLALQRALGYGSLTRIKIDNMREQHEEQLLKEMIESGEVEVNDAQEEPKKNVELKEYGFISVSSGEGLSDIFKGLGVDEIIEGGQTMNPSTEDILLAIDKVNAKNIYVLPNNKNIILAANQASELIQDKNIMVVPTKTIPQGLSAVIAFMPNINSEENLENMKEEINNVKSLQVTYAVRTTSIDDFEIEEGDIMAIGDSGIVSVGKSIDETLLDGLAKLIDDDTELVSLYYGADIKEEEAEKLKGRLSDIYNNIDIELNKGSQAVYYYIASVE
jgi:DAK2 domain fusion protein yloV